jgi:cation:H+ antiporter
LNIAITILLVLAGFALLVKGADLLVEGASSTAKQMKISELVIGLTIVAIGTSMPEMIVNILSAWRSHNDVVFGNIIGSNIFNTMVILGIAGLIYPMTVKHSTVWKEIPYAFGITLLLLFLINDTWFFPGSPSLASRSDGLILVGLFMVFVWYVFRQLRDEIDMDEGDIRVLNNTNTTLYILGGIAGISIGGHLVVTYAVQLAQQFAVSEKLIGLTVVSAGTSLPELATSVVAAVKRKSDIAIGNVLGSNIFNITLVLGTTALIRPVQFDVVLNIDLLILLLGTGLLFLFMFTLTVRKLDRWEAFILVIISIAYLAFVFIRK